MTPPRSEAQILADLDHVSLDLAQIDCYLEGSLQRSVKRYLKKDGTVSQYELPPVLQYPLEGGGQGRMRIPSRHVPLVRTLLDAGRRRRELLARHRALALEWASLRMRGPADEKKRRDAPARPVSGLVRRQAARTLRPGGKRPRGAPRT